MKPTAPLIAALLAAGLASSVQAKPPGPQTFCVTYPESPHCRGQIPSCDFCHASPPTRNVFGASVEAALSPGAARPLSDDDFAAALPAALLAVANADSDGDGFSNALEIEKGSLPAEASSKPEDTSCAGGPNPQFEVCKYDAAYAYRKLRLDFCGKSPTYDELQAFRALDAGARTAELAAALDACLASEFWRGKNGQLWELAHRKIRPVGSIKSGTEDRGVIPLADYYDDYALWAWSQLDDHDAREVLTADYFVSRAANPTRYTQVASRSGQGVVADKRAGNLTTAWNLVYNVMFTALPRNAASQVYRSYLGFDIARQEGLFPIASEPRDYDGKGVSASGCAQCHATLDPLSYPFRNYNGLGGPGAVYEPNRIENRFADEAPSITQIPESGYLMGQPVSDLRAWAQVAANSDPFAAALVGDYWELLIGQPPTPEERPVFERLWTNLATVHGYSVRKMLHELVATEAYGAP